ncbi:MAG: hypothetical protein GWP14_04615 [Actinobacteria bacterium]|nr:hypothetical protein [Actinomycetota bacterium]
MAIIIDIAEAVKEELNGGTFSQAFTAERHYQPVFELKDMKTLHVTVVPKEIEMQLATRNTSQHDCGVDVAIQKKLESVDLAEIDELMGFVEEIIAFISRRKLASVPGALWIKTANEPIYAAEHMEQFRQFTSILTLTYRVLV